MRVTGARLGCGGTVAVLLVGVGLYLGISWVVQQIRWATADTGDLVARLADTDAGDRAKARERLVDTGEAAVAPLAATLDRGEATQRREAALALSEIGGDEAYAAVAAALDDEAEAVRASAEAGLVKAGHDAVPALVGTLKSDDPALAASSARLLGSIGDAAAGHPLKQALDHRVAAVRAAAARAVGMLGVESAASKLVVLLGDPDGRVRAGARGALVKLDDAAVKPLLRALNSSRARVREGAVVALGRLRVKAAAPKLARMLNDKSGPVRLAVEDALVAMGKAAVAPLSGKLGVAAGATKWVAADILLRIAESDPDAVKPLLQYLRSGSVRGVADRYAFFIRLGRKGSEGLLIQALNSYGNVDMAEDYLNCGNDRLDAAARRWAAARGYSVTSTPGYYGGPVWGSGSD